MCHEEHAWTIPTAYYQMAWNMSAWNVGHSIQQSMPDSSRPMFEVSTIPCLPNFPAILTFWNHLMKIQKGISHVRLYADNFYRFCNKLVDSSIKVHSMDFPLCLYNKALIDKEDPSAGLMWSKLLVAVCFSIFVINYNINFSSSFSNTFSLGHRLLWRMGWVAAKRRGVRPKKTTWRNLQQVWSLMLQPR